MAAPTTRPGHHEIDASIPPIHLHVVLEAPIELGRVAAAFGDEAPNWLGQPSQRSTRGLVDYLCDLELGVSPGRRAVFRKSAIVSLGVPRLEAGWVIPIEWRAASLAPLFPVLVGRLILTSDRIAIDGHYAPPFGPLGYVLDRGVLGVAAQATARWFLARLAGVLAP